MAKTARRLAAIAPSPTLAVSARAKALAAQGRSILDLSAGEPDFATPEHVRAAAGLALERGETHYTEVDGTPTLKRAISAKLSRENGLDYTPGEIIATCGAKQAMFNLCLALLDAGDEVIVPAPYWVSYPAIVRIAGATPIIVESSAATGFKMTGAQLRSALSPKTRLVVLNGPNNPTGATYSRQELESLGDVLEEHPEVVVASDDIYEHLVYGTETFFNLPMAVPSFKNRTVVINGVSKAYAMTGWRLGYAAGPEWLIAVMRKLQSQSTSNPASVSQAAAVAALEGDQQCVATMREAFRRRRDLFVPALNDLPGIRCDLPPGAFYAFADCREAIGARGLSDDVGFANWLLDEAGVAAVPGDAFGAPGYLRFSYAAEDTVLEAAVDKMKAALS